jgi:hypothetical protein
MTMNKKLTATESRVLQLIAEQKKSKEIAELFKEIPFASVPIFLNHGKTPSKIVDVLKPTKNLYPLL